MFWFLGIHKTHQKVTGTFGGLGIWCFWLPLEASFGWILHLIFEVFFSYFHVDDSLFPSCLKTVVRTPVHCAQRGESTFKQSFKTSFHNLEIQKDNMIHATILSHVPHVA